MQIIKDSRVLIIPAVGHRSDRCRTTVAPVWLTEDVHAVVDRITATTKKNDARGLADCLLAPLLDAFRTVRNRDHIERFVGRLQRFEGGVGAGGRREVGEVFLDGDFQEVAVPRDDEVDLALPGGIDEVDGLAELEELAEPFDECLARLGIGVGERLVGEIDGHDTRFRDRLAGCVLGLVVGLAEGVGAAHDLAGRFHLGAETRIRALQAVERQDDLLDAGLFGDLLVDREVVEGRAGHHLRGEFGDRDARRLRDERDGTGGTRVGFQDVHHAVLDGQLDV